MLAWIIQFSFLSLILIFLVHHLFVFFKDTLTIPKTKDLVNTPTRKYENMFQAMEKNSKNANTELDLGIGKIDIDDMNNMKDELKNYFRSQSIEETNKTTSEYQQYQDTTSNIGYYNTTYITDLGTTPL